MIVFDGRIVAFAISLIILARIFRALQDNAEFLGRGRPFIAPYDIRLHALQALATSFEVQSCHWSTVWVVHFFRNSFFLFYFAVIDVLRVSDDSHMNLTADGKVKLFFIYHDKPFGYGKRS